MALTVAMPLGYKVRKKAKNGLIHLDYCCCIQQDSFKKNYYEHRGRMNCRTFASHPYYCWVFEQFTILRNKLIEWAFMSFIWIWMHIEGKVKEKKWTNCPNEQLFWDVLISRSSYHNFFRIFMARVIHELGYPPNEIEATNICMYTVYRVWLRVFRTIQARQIKRNHNPGPLFRLWN